MTSDLATNSPWSGSAGTDMGAMRAEAERVQHEVERLKATRIVASAAHDTADARDLLSMLGISADDIRAAVGRRTVAA
jgi:hypothetical protein